MHLVAKLFDYGTHPKKYSLLAQHIFDMIEINSLHKVF